MKMKSDGSGVTRLASAGRARNFMAVAPSFAPNGKRVVYATGARGTIKTIRTNGKRRRTVLDAPPRSPLLDPEYSPTGDRILFSGTPKKKEPSGLWTMRRNGLHLRLVTGSQVGGAGYSFSPDGKRIAFVGPKGLGTIKPSGSRFRLLNRQAFYPAWSPSGERLAFTMSSSTPSDPQDCSDIYTVTPAGLDERRVTDNCAQPRPIIGAHAFQPSWQPRQDTRLKK